MRTTYKFCLAMTAGLTGLILRLLPRAYGYYAWEGHATWATNVHSLGIWGSNVATAFVEADNDPSAAVAYRVNPDFTTSVAGFFNGKVFTYYDPGTDLYTNYSDHAGIVAVYGVGRYSNSWPVLASRGTAPGSTQVGNYEASHFISAYLATNTPLTEKVFSLAWTSLTGTTVSLTALMDAMVDSQLKFVVQGVRPQNTNYMVGGGLHPLGMGIAYNVLTVGTCLGSYEGYGASQYGPSHHFETCKPELLCDSISESAASGRGAGGAVLILDQALKGGWTNAQDPRAIKAIMLAGARKTTNWDKGTPGPDDDHHVPLDYHAGAGILDCLNNYGIVYGGEVDIGSTNRSDAWDLGVVDAGTTNCYYFDARQSNVYFGCALTWHRHVDGSSTNLPNLDLRLYSVSDGTLTTLTDWSTSVIESVEHVWYQIPATGLYAVAVDGGLLANAEIYGLAWRFCSSTNALLFDADLDGVADSYEEQHFNGIYYYKGSDDPDGDGADNYAEYIANTQPTNSTDVFRIVAAEYLADNTFEITFVSSTARVYDAWFNDHFSTNAALWSPVSSGSVWGNGGLTNWTDDGSRTGIHPSQAISRVYRMEVSRP